MKVQVMSARTLGTIRLSADTTRVVPVLVPTEEGQRQIATLHLQEGSWVVIPAEDCRFVQLEGGTRPLVQRQLSLEENPSLVIQIQGRELVRMLAEKESGGRNEFSRYTLPIGTSVRVGSSPDCEICYEGFGHSAAVFELRCGSQLVAVNLHALPWNLYCNGRSVNTVSLQQGDRLYCGGLTLLIGPGFVDVDRIGQGGTCQLAAFAGPTYCALPAEPEHDVEFAAAPSLPLLEQDEEIQVQPPPTQPEEMEKSSNLLTMLPSLMMTAAMLTVCLFSVNGTTASGNLVSVASSLVMAGCMGISCVIPVFTRRREERMQRCKRLQNEAEYRDYLEKLKQRIRRECEIERFNLLQRNPPLEGDRQVLAIPGTSTTVSVESCVGRSRMNGWKGLWERKPADRDFLQVAVGRGDLSPACRIKKPNPPEIGELPALYQEMEQCLQNTPRLQNVPVTLDLCKHHLVGLVGKDRDLVCRMALGLLVELTALHGCEDLRIVVIHGEKEQSFWQFARWMPHIWNSDGEYRFLANDLGEIKSMSQRLQQVLHQRRQEHKDKFSPWYVIVDADEELSSRAEVLRELCGDALTSTGFTLLQLRQTTRQLTRNCSAILDTDQQILELRQGSTARRLALSALASFAGDALALFRNMSHIHPAGSEEGQSFPRSLSFMDMLRAGSTAQLNIVANWRRSDPVHTLQAEIGQDRDGFAVMLDIHDKAHGPHGLVAGMTGSGKSEFLISYILAMAVRYRPDEVSFVLIDFKGGGMADVFRGMPHLVGSITNLDGNELRRSFLAIESELERRQQIFKQTTRSLGISSVDIYSYQDYYRQGKVKEPLPHLILISDEFAELKQQQGDFMDQLIRIARIGRSLGVHMILATQKPDGVVNDQILSNTRFRVCLKVQSRSDSQSMLGVPDAAAIPCAGRFYLQVGFNEVFEQGQSGYSGAPYREKDCYEPPRDLAVELLNEQGIVVAAASPAAPASSRRQVAAVLEAVHQAAMEIGFHPVSLWQQALPVVRPVLRAQKTEGIAPRVGNYDDLFHRTHPDLRVPLEQKGSAVVYGAAGAGKAAFLERLLIECMENFAPQQVRFYIADAEAGTLQAFANGSHTAFLAMPGEFAAYGEMLEDLCEELEQRRVKLQPYGGERERYLAAGYEMPLLVTVIHDLSSFLSGMDSDELLDRLRELGRSGRKYGIVLMLTATDSRSVHYSLRPLLTQIFVLRLTSEDEYDELLGRTGGMRPAEGVGRGLVRIETPGRDKGYAICEYQVDVPFADTVNPYEALCTFVQAHRRADERVQLPERLSPEYFAGMDCTRHAVPVACSRKGESVTWNFFEDPILQASLPTDPALARGLAVLLRRSCGEDLLVLDGSGTFGQVEGCHVVTDSEEMKEAVEEFLNKLVKAIERDNEYYEKTGKDLEEPALGLLICDSDNTAALLDIESRAKLNDILEYRNNTVMLVRAALCRYEEGVASRFPALDSLRPVCTGLALTPPQQYGQSLFACDELTSKSKCGGLVRDGKLITCRFAKV